MMTIEEYIQALDEDIYEHELERVKLVRSLADSVRYYSAFNLYKSDKYKLHDIMKYSRWETEQGQLADWLRELVERRKNDV